MERDVHLKHRRSIATRRRLDRAAGQWLLATLGVVVASSAYDARAQVPDLTIGKDTTIGTRTNNNLIIQALSNDTNVTQADGTTLTLQGGFITINGTNVTSLGNAAGTGRLNTGTGEFDVIINDGSVFTLSSILLGVENRLSVNGGTTILTSTQNQITGGIIINGGAALRVATEANLGPVNNPIILNGGNLEVSQSLTFDGKRVFTVQRSGGAIVPLANATVSLLGNNQIQGTIGTFRKEGAGLLVIGGTNTFNRGVIVNQGILELDNPGAFGGTAAGAPKSPIQLNSGATLRLKSDAKTLNFNDPINVNGVSLIDFGRDTLTDGGDFFLGPLTFPQPDTTTPQLLLRNFKQDKSALHFTDVALPQTGIFNLAANTTIMIDGTASGAGGINKVGSGILYLNGSTSNSLGATSFVSGGTLVLAKSPGLVAISNDLQISGGLVRLDATGQFGASSDVVVNGGTLNFNSFNTAFGTLTNNGGVIRTGAALGFLRGALGAPVPGGIAGPVAGPLPVPTLPALNLTGGTTTIDPGGQIAAVSVLVSGGTNTVSATGKLTVGSGGMFMSGTNAPNITLLADAVTPGVLQLAGDLTSANAPGASLTSAGAGALAGQIDLGGATRTFTVDGAATDRFSVSTSVINGGIAKSGVGVLVLSGANTYSGGTTISNGTVEVTAPSGLGTGPVTLGGGQLNLRTAAGVVAFANAVSAMNVTAALDVNNDPAAPGTLGTIQLPGITLGGTTGSNTSRLILQGANRNVQFTGVATINAGTATIENVAGVGVNFSNALTQAVAGAGFQKDGAGTVTFDGGAINNTYTGLTRVNAGTLLLARSAGMNAVPGNLDLFGPGVVRLNAPNQIVDAAVVNVNVGSTLNLNGQTERVSQLGGTGGSVTLGGGTLTVTQGTFPGVISGAGRLVQDNIAGGVGATFTMSGATPQTFTGGVSVNHGVVNFSAQAPGHVGTTLTGGLWEVRNGSALNFNAGLNIATIASPTTVAIDGAGSTFTKLNSVSANQSGLSITGGAVFPSVGSLPNLNNSGTLTVAGAGSRLTVNNGMTNPGIFAANTGTTLAGGGTISTSGQYTVSGAQTYLGGTTFNVTGGTATLNSDAGAPGAFRLNVNASGGALNLNSTEHLASLTVSGTVGLGAPAASEPIPADPVPAAPTAGNKLLVTQALGVTVSGTLDIQNNALIVDYPAVGPSPLTSVRAAIVGGFNAFGTKWAGHGITSSTAAANAASFGIGYTEASAVVSYDASNTGNFRGEIVDKTAVLARFTKLGDANLDGSVDFNDLVKLAQSYNTSGTSWNSGDFTYDGVTDFNDLVKLAQNYNTALPSDAVPGAPANFEADLARAFASVPEPSAPGVALAAAFGLAARRRRRRSRTSPSSP